MKTRKFYYGRPITIIISLVLLMQRGESTRFSSRPSLRSSTPSSTSSGAPLTNPTSSSHNPTNESSSTPSDQPTTILSSAPSRSVTSIPSSVSSAPTSTRSGAPSMNPTSFPSYNPTKGSSSTPSNQLTQTWSSAPSKVTTLNPSSKSLTPTLTSSSAPSTFSSYNPTHELSSTPSKEPTKMLTSIPSIPTSSNPSSYPSNQPSLKKTYSPRTSKKSNSPSGQPSKTSSAIPSKSETLSPSSYLSKASSSPSLMTTESPQPSLQPSLEQSNSPSEAASFSPTQETSLSHIPSSQPSESPNDGNTSPPSLLPFNSPSSIPSTIVSSIPSEVPTEVIALTQLPSVVESSSPSSLPSAESLAPSSDPSSTTTSLPSSSTLPPPPRMPWCMDSRESLQVIRPGSDERDITCLWVDEAKETRCRIDGVRQHCPRSCDFCQCIDNPGTFGNLKTCSWVGNKPDRRCSLEFYAENCPASCGRCDYYFPSATPTVSFSVQPTASRSVSPSLLPSTAPTQLNSAVPSSEPLQSISPRPSNLRTQNPSVAPSSNPSADFVLISTDVVLGFESFSFPMDDTVKPTFEEVTKDFLMKNKKNVEGQEVEIISVTVLRQYRIGGIKDGVRDNRLLQSVDDTGLVVSLSVAGLVKPSSVSSDNFAFADTVLNGFNNNFVAYKNMLQLEPTIINSVTKFDGGTQYPETEGNHLLTIIYIGCSIAGGVLIAFLSIIFIKFRNDRTPVLPRDLTFQDENEFIQSQGARALPLNRSYGDSNNADEQPRSLNSQSTTSLRPVFYRSFAKSNSRESNRSPRRGETDTNADASARSSTWHHFDQWVGEPGNQNNYNVRNSGSHEMRNNTQHDYPNQMQGHIALSNTTSDSDHEDSLGLNVSPKALLEAQRRSQQFSFVPQEQDSMVGLFPPVNAYNDDAIDRNQSKNYSMAISSISGSENFVTIEHQCPPGPLGLIIDTSTKGPIVHTVKTNSSVKGYVLPGDIIIGLDGKDTSSMTAPMITSYMASKAQQQQRRLTMLRMK